jgi:hypothetical protein
MVLVTVIQPVFFIGEVFVTILTVIVLGTLNVVPVERDRRPKVFIARVAGPMGGRVFVLL